MTALDERPVTAQAPAAPFVHWWGPGSVFGNPAQCGADEGRATRVACAVTCPACIAWMTDESWSARDTHPEVAR